MLLVAARYKFGTYLEDADLQYLRDRTLLTHLDVRGLPSARRSATLHDHLRSADALICAPWGGQGLETVAGWVDFAPRLRAIAGTFDFRVAATTGLDHSMLANRSLTVVDSSRTMARTVAEFCVGMIINALRGIPRRMEVLRAGGWTHAWVDEEQALSGDVQGKTIGLAGFGAVNQTVARLLEPFGCTLLTFDPAIADSSVPDHVTGLQSLEEVASASDVLVVGIPLTEATRCAVDAEVIESLPRGAVVVLPTRMGVVDEAAMLRRLNRGELLAAIDVFSQEPLPKDSPYANHPQVLATPHMAGNTAQAHRRCFRASSRALVDVLDGLPSEHVVTPADALIYEGAD